MVGLRFGIQIDSVNKPPVEVIPVSPGHMFKGWTQTQTAAPQSTITRFRGHQGLPRESSHPARSCSLVMVSPRATQRPRASSLPLVARHSHPFYPCLSRMSCNIECGDLFQWKQKQIISASGFAARSFSSSFFLFLPLPLLLFPLPLSLPV